MTQSVTTTTGSRLRALRAVLACLAGLVAHGAQAQAQIDFVPAALQIAAGEDALVEIRVTGVDAQGLAALQLEFAYDTALLTIGDPNEGFTASVEPFAPLGGDPQCTAIRGTATCEDPAWLLTATGRTAVNGLADIDNVVGTTRILTGTLTDASAASGSGALAMLRVSGVADGTGAVSIATAILADGQVPPSAVDLQITTLSVTVGTATDSDGDGVADSMDNCTLVPNANQRDTNGDGYGNICDADITNDGIVNVLDLGAFKAVFFTTNADSDFNGDGIVNVLDLGILKNAFFQPPGPSGVAP